MRHAIATAIMALALTLPGSALAATKSSSSSRSSGSSSSASKVSAPAPKTAPKAQTSSSSVTQTKQALSQVPRKLKLASKPPSFRSSKKQSRLVPKGHNYGKDYSKVRTNYSSPYASNYFGVYGSPYFYLWPFLLYDGDSTTVAYPPADDDGDDLSGALTSYLGSLPTLYELARG